MNKYANKENKTLKKLIFVVKYGKVLLSFAQV